MQSPHAHPVIVMDTPEIFLAFESLHKSIIFFAVGLFGWFAFPCPLIIGFLFLFFRFLGGSFLGGQFVTGRFLFVLVGGRASSFFL